MSRTVRMVALIALAMAPNADAGSLDMLEVAGPWGTPLTANPAATWWNPASLAAGEGTEILLEYAPVTATVDFTRADPNGGTDALLTQGEVPFGGVRSDLFLHRWEDHDFGLGLALAVPYAHGSRSTVEDGAARYHLMEGGVKSTDLIGALAWEYKDRISAGAAIHFMQHHWSANTKSEIMPDLHDALTAEGKESGYTDADLENERYSAELSAPSLEDSGITWSFGLRGQVHEMVSVGVAHIRPLGVTATGDASVAFDCPPDQDLYGRMGSEMLGLCDATLLADASVSYELPARWHFSVAVTPIEPLTVEAFGGWVGWSVFEDYVIVVSGVEDKNEFHTDQAAESTPDLVNKTRLWAREGQNTFFAGLDGKFLLRERWTLGARGFFDHHSIPDIAVSPNNFDTDLLTLTGLVAFRPITPLRLGVSATQGFAKTREITTSGFAMAIDPEARLPDRWFYPHANGTYAMTFRRFGFSAGVAF